MWPTVVECNLPASSTRSSFTVHFIENTSSSNSLNDIRPFLIDPQLLSGLASGETAGVNLLPDLSKNSPARVCDLLRSAAKPGDISVVSIHWGPNWGYEIPDEQRRFAHKLVDETGVSVIHGHSSHHPKAIEVYRNRLILYGCGDFLNDYEGIEGYEEYRADLSLMYFVDVDTTSGDLVALELTPLQIRRFRLEPAASIDAEWIARRLDRESAKFGVTVERASAQSLTVAWL